MENENILSEKTNKDFANSNIINEIGEPLYKNKDWLYEKYVIEKLSLRKIADLCNTNQVTVYNYVKKYEIHTRTISESLIGYKQTPEHIENSRKQKIGRKMPPVSEETRRKISQSTTGENHWNYGNKLSEETKRKISEKHQGKKMSDESKQRMSDSAFKRFDGNPENHPLYRKTRDDIKGPNHPLWNGGKTTLYKQIRTTRKFFWWHSNILKRDNKTCCLCKKTNCVVEVDHIKPYAIIIYEHKITTVEQALACEELWDINNGRTLCEHCHHKTDTYGGKTKQKIRELVFNEYNNKETNLEVI